MKRWGTVLGVTIVLFAIVAPARAGDARVLEKDTNLDESLRLASILRQAGLDVRLTRSDNTFVALGSRSAAGTGADLFVSVHNNAGPPSTHGTEIYSQVGNHYGARVARTLLGSVSKSAGTTPRFVYARPGAQGDYYAVLRGNRATALIVEGAYLTNPEEVRRLADPAFRQRIAQGIADGVLAEFAALPHPQGDGAGPKPADANHTLLSAPSNLTVSLRGTSTATLRWDSNNAVGGFRVWRDGIDLGAVSSSAASLTDHVAGAGIHHYQVRAELDVGPVEEVSPTSAVALVLPWHVVIDPGHGGRDPGAVGHL